MRAGDLRLRLLLLVVAAVAPALALDVYAYREQQRILAAQIQAEALRLARVASTDYERLIEGGRQLLISLARLSEIRRRDSACDALLADLADQYPYYLNFAAHAPDGSTFCTGMPLPDSTEFTVSAWFRRAVETRQFTVGEYQIGPGGRPAVTIAYPVAGAGGSVETVISASLDLTWLNQLAAGARLPRGSTLTVIDRNGTVLARYPGPEAWIGRSFPEAPIVEAILDRREGTAEAPGIDGLVRLYGFAGLTGPSDGGVYVSVGIPRSAAFAEARGLFERNLAAMAIVALAVLAVAWMGAGLFVLRPVNALLAAADRVRAGDLGARTGLVEHGGELGRLGRAFDEMAAALQARQAEAARAEQALQQGARELQTLSRRLVNAQETERRQVARELHDEIGQVLTGLKLSLELVAQQTEGEAERRVREAQKAVNDLVARVRDLSLNLRPAMLDDLGLVSTLLWYFDRYTAQTGIQVGFSSHGLDRRFPSEVETAAYRIIQEALTNVARHAGTDRADVFLRADAWELGVEVEDRGRGFDAEAALAAGSTAGVAGMRERVLLLGGRLAIDAVPGGGTRLTARLPLAARNGDGPGEAP